MKRSYVQVVRCRLTQYARGSMGLLLLLLFTACGGMTQAPTVETLAATAIVSERGSLLLEAGAFHANTPRGAHSWKQKAGALHALPDVRTNHNTNYTTQSPRLDYRINVKKSGTYFVWVRGKAAGKARSTSDSLHIGVNGKAVGSADRMGGFPGGFGWRSGTMDGSRGTLKLPAGTHTLNVWMREDGFAFDKIILTNKANAKPEAVLAEFAPKAAGAFGPSAKGLIEVPAQAFSARRAPGQHTWQAVGDAMQALPDRGTNQNSNFAKTSPCLDYRVNFTEPGTYYLWVRGKAAGTSRGTSDSLHVGLNGRALSSADRITGFGTDLGWQQGTMDDAAATIKVAKAGVHTLNVWMREDGFAFDKLVLTSNRSYAPSSAGAGSSSAASGPTLLPIGNTTGSASTSNLERVQAEPADAFIDTMGINTHLHYQGTVYDERYSDIIKPKLLELGVRHVRDGAYTYEDADRNTFFYERLRELGAAGVRFNLITSLETPYNEATDYSKLDDIVAWTDGAVESFEGINEPDIQGIDDWISLTKAAQKNLYTAVRGNPALKDVEVLGPSPVWSAGKLGDLSRYMDLGNTHPYPGGKMPTGDEHGQSTKSSLKNAAKNSRNKSVMFTETGYHNALETDNDHAPTSEATTAKYLPRMFFEHFNMGVPRTYLYELIDSKSKGRTTNPEASFGLLRHDGSEKPAFKATKNLTQLLADAGPSFTPEALSFALSGNTDDVHHTLLQKRNGTFYLALWVEKESWDRDARREVRVDDQALTVALDPSVKNATLYTLDGSGRMSQRPLSLRDNQLSVEIGDSVSILELRN